MCTWFYAEKSTLSLIITKAQQLPLADTIRNTMSRSAEMSGSSIVKKALTNMVMEKAKDIPDPVPSFMQI